MKNVTSDEMKLRILDAMRKLQSGKSMDEWFTANQIFWHVVGRTEAKRGALQSMAAEGWLHIRHAPDMPERLFYRLKSDYC